MRKLLTLLAALALAAPLMLYGCSGDDGADGRNGTNAPTVRMHRRRPGRSRHRQELPTSTE